MKSGLRILDAGAGELRNRVHCGQLTGASANFVGAYLVGIEGVVAAGAVFSVSYFVSMVDLWRRVQKWMKSTRTNGICAKQSTAGA